MKLRSLVISDIHGSKRGLNRVKASIHKYSPDLVCCCGDITHFGGEESASKILEKIDSKIIGVIGNCDPENVKNIYQEIEGEYIDISTYEKGGFTFTGLSGSNYGEEKVQRFEELSPQSDIFVFHSPPFGYLDKTSRGKHIGERSLLSIIEKDPPDLILSGHVHESQGIIEEEGTTYMNPGPLADDQLGLVDISKEEGIEARLL